MGILDIISGEGKGNSENEEIEFCVACGAKIPRWKYEENGGCCDHCVVEDSAIGML